MINIRTINDTERLLSVAAYHYGWSEQKSLQKKYLGNPFCLEIAASAGESFYAIFNTANQEQICQGTCHHLLFKDQDRVLIETNGMLYRYLISEKQILAGNCYSEIICNEAGTAPSKFFHSRVIPEQELMIVVDREGIAALNWHGVVWKQKFARAASGHLEILNVNEREVIASYEESYDIDVYYLAFDLKTGRYTQHMTD